MNNTNTGGPAFPRAPFKYIDNGNGLEWDVREQSGMTLRDYFAAKAMQGLLAQSMGTALGSDPKFAAEYAYAMADAMLKASQV
jgi:hypothetical protein